MSPFRVVLLCCSFSLIPATLAASDLDALLAEIDAKGAAMLELESKLEDQAANVERLSAALERARAAEASVEQRNSEALAAFQARFERVVNDPSLDLTAAHQNYRAAFEDLSAHREAMADQERRLRDNEGRVAEIRAARQDAEQAVATLRASINRVRAERLSAELNVVGEIELTSVTSCTREETIGACIARGEEEARRLARERFNDQTLAAVTEAEVVAKHRGDATPSSTLLDSTVTAGSFRGQGDYQVELRARLRYEASEAQACKLLGLTSAQCLGDLQAPGGSPPPDVAARDEPEAPEETRTQSGNGPTAAAGDQHRLTVRSNVYYDEVFIDGVAYGSTKLDVMLPAGEYDLEVRKPGHETYRTRIRLADDQTVTARLAEVGP
jgi:hypothetical protein